MNNEIKLNVSQSRGYENKFPGVVTEKGIITNDYFWFEKNEANRDLNHKNLEFLKKNFNENADGDDYPFQEPIVVFWKKGMERGSIQSGHHRFEICQKYKKKINYVITDCYRECTEGHEEAYQGHSCCELVDEYRKQGKSGYIVLTRLKEEFPKYSDLTLTIFMDHEANKKERRYGQLNIIGDEDQVYEKAKNRILKYEEFLLASRRKDKSKELIKVILHCLEREDFDWDYFIKRCQKNSEAALLTGEFKSIVTLAKARSLIKYYYNTGSIKDYFVF